MATVRVRFDLVLQQGTKLIGAADVLSVELDLRHFYGCLGTNNRLHPRQHFIERPWISNYVVINIFNTSLVEIALSPKAVRAGYFAKQHIAGNLRAFGMGIDNGFGQDPVIKGLSLIDDLAFDHDDGRVPTAFKEWLPLLHEPVADTGTPSSSV